MTKVNAEIQNPLQKVRVTPGDNMQATYKQIYERLLMGRQVKVRFSDRKQAESLRVQLVRWNQQHVAVSITDNSLCMTWQEESSTAVFRLDKSKGREPALFEILEDDPTEIPDTLPDSLEHNSSSYGTSSSSLSEEDAGTSNQSDAAAQEPSEHG